MRMGSRIAVAAGVVAALAVLILAGVACGSSEDAAAPQWQEVLTSQISGEKPVKLNLGTHQLGTKVRLAWDLTGPDKPPVILTFRLINADYGTGFGYSLEPTDGKFTAKTDNAMTIGPIKPGNFLVYFSQRFAPGQGPGYDGTITVYTLK
jgi:hypothetical protein